MDLDAVQVLRDTAKAPIPNMGLRCGIDMKAWYKDTVGTSYIK
jgi:hypothetical protein